MSISHIPLSTRLRLWGKAGGRCEYEGCNTPLWLDGLTKWEFNQAYIAHIIADKPDGPRGDPELSEKLKTCITNLMLLCDTCHRRIDKHDLAGHPVDQLRRMKEAHEARVEIVTGIAADKFSHVLLYGPNIGEHSSPLDYALAARAMVPLVYPAEREPIRLEMMDSAMRDRDVRFWQVEEENLVRKFRERVQPRLADGTIRHLSVFARAPQPLLIRLGTLLTDIAPGEVYQLHREPQGWVWPAAPITQAFKEERPGTVAGPAALVLSLSATITDDRITSALGSPATIWRLTVPNPNHDCIQSREQLRDLRRSTRMLLDRIKAMHGQDAVLHVFPAVPVSVAIELGRVRQPKADLAWSIYDQNNALGGFRPSLTIL